MSNCAFCCELLSEKAIHENGRLFCSYLCVKAWKRAKGIGDAHENAAVSRDFQQAVDRTVNLPVHPLELAFLAAVHQATSGKGERHGGDSIPFYRQQWVLLAEHHGPGFLTGQAAKKLNEAANGYDTSEITNEAYERELLGAIVYAGMAWLKLKGYPEP